MVELYWRDEDNIKPGKANSNLNIRDNPKPIEPPINPDKIYTPPIKIWLVEVKRLIRLKTRRDERREEINKKKRYKIE